MDRILMIPKYIYCVYTHSCVFFFFQFNGPGPTRKCEWSPRYGELSGNQTAEIMRMGATRGICYATPGWHYPFAEDSTLMFIQSAKNTHLL